MSHVVHVCPYDGSPLVYDEKTVDDGHRLIRRRCPEGDFASSWMSPDPPGMTPEHSTNVGRPTENVLLSKGQAGPQGPVGPQGPSGPPGGAQRRWYGEGPPTVVVGAAPGDEYMDTLTGDLYLLA